MEMVLTGKFISAEEALYAGLINRIAPVSSTWKRLSAWPPKWPDKARWR